MKSSLKKSNILLVLFTKNNIICTLTSLSGNVLSWITAGSLKVRGTKKITSSVTFSIIKALKYYNKKFEYTKVHIKIKGLNKNKNLFIKQLKLSGFDIISFQEDVVLPYNGCKKTNIRRV